MISFIQLLFGGRGNEDGGDRDGDCCCCGGGGVGGVGNGGDGNGGVGGGRCCRGSSRDCCRRVLFKSSLRMQVFACCPWPL